MKVKVIGKKKGSFASENGELMEYAKLFCLCSPPVGDGNLYEGLYPDTYSINPQMYNDIPVDCDVDIGTNSKGKVVAIELL